MGHQRDFTQTSAQRQPEVMDWVAKVTGRSFDKNDMHGSLKDGIILSELVNKIAPGTVTGIKNSKLAFVQMQNVTLVIQGMRKLGVGEQDNFSTIDLYEDKDRNQVLQALESLSRVSRNISTFNGPYIGARQSERKAPSSSSNKKSNYVGGLMEQKQQNIHTKLGPDVVKGRLTNNDFSHTHSSAKTSSPKMKTNAANSVGLLERKVQDMKIDHDKVHASLTKNDWSHTHSKNKTSSPVKKPVPSVPPKAKSSTVTASGGRTTSGSSSAKPSTSNSSSSGGDPYAEIEKLHGLMQKGILTEEEFAMKKKQLLGL